MSQDTPGWSPSGPSDPVPDPPSDTPGWGQPSDPPEWGQPSGGAPQWDPPSGGAPQWGPPQPPPGSPPPSTSFPYGAAPGSRGGQPSAPGGPPYPGAQYSGPGGYPAAPVSPDDGTWALMAYISTFFAGLIGPLVVYFTKRDQSPFVRYHAAQSLNLMLTGTIYSLGLLVLATVAGAVTHGVGFLLFFLVWLALGVVDAVYVIVAAVAAHRGSPVSIPRWLALSLVR
jgi:uncharacterized protein